MVNWCWHYHFKRAYWGDNWWFPIICEEIIVFTRLTCGGVFKLLLVLYLPICEGVFDVVTGCVHKDSRLVPSPTLQFDILMDCTQIFQLSVTDCNDWKVKRNLNVSKSTKLNVHHTIQNSVIPSHRANWPSAYHACWWEQHVTCQMTTPQTSLWKSSLRQGICNIQYKML